MSTLTIRPQAATQDAQDIKTIVDEIDKAMQDLDATIKQIIPEGVETAWSKTLKENWETFYNKSVAGVMDEMKLSAVNLQKAVEEAIKYGQG